MKEADISITTKNEARMKLRKTNERKPDFILSPSAYYKATIAIEIQDSWFKKRKGSLN